MWEIYVKGSETGERVEASLWVVSQSGARCATLSPLNPRHHLARAFPLQMEELRCREGGVPAHDLQSAAPTPSFSFLIIPESGPRTWFGEVVGRLLGSLALAQDPQAQGT